MGDIVLQSKSFVVRSTTKLFATVVDPDFPEGWCQPQIGDANLLFDQMFAKNCMKINEIEIERYPPVSN